MRSLLPSGISVKSLFPMSNLSNSVSRDMDLGRVFRWFSRSSKKTRWQKSTTNHILHTYYGRTIVILATGDSSIDPPKILSLLSRPKLAGRYSKKVSLR